VIATLLLSASFMIIILVGMMMVVVQFKKWAERRDVLIQNRIDELSKRIDETQNIMRGQLSDILSQFKNLLK
jgi:predicted PurR-regulated permease PerM